MSWRTSSKSCRSFAVSFKFVSYLRPSAVVIVISAIVPSCITLPSETARKKSGNFGWAAAKRSHEACVFQVKGDPITDLTEDLAAEQKARSTYDNILRLISDPEICDPIRFLRQREIVHFQRFGEALVHVQEGLPKNVYAYNPAFDNKKHC